MNPPNTQAARFAAVALALLAASPLSAQPVPAPAAAKPGEDVITLSEFSVRADTPNRQLAGRLLDFMKRTRASFENAGFSWRGDEPAVRSDKIEVPPWLRANGTGPNGTAK